MIPIETLYDHARTLQTLYPRLSAAVTEPSDGGAVDPDTPKQTKFVYEIPWNTPAADLKYSIHADARRYETALNVHLFGRAKYRGPSDDNTLAAIGRLPVLIDHARAKRIDNHDVTDTIRLLASWPRQIRLLFDEALPGESPGPKPPATYDAHTATTASSSNQAGNTTPNKPTSTADGAKTTKDKCSGGRQRPGSSCYNKTQARTDRTDRLWECSQTSQLTSVMAHGNSAGKP